MHFKLMHQWHFRIDFLSIYLLAECLVSSTDRGPGDVKEAPGVFCCGGLVGHHNGGLIYDWGWGGGCGIISDILLTQWRRQ